MTKFLKKRVAGFTIIEIVLVVGVLVLLFTIIFATMSSVRAKSRDAERLSDLRKMKLAFDFYIIDNQIMSNYLAPRDTLAQMKS